MKQEEELVALHEVKVSVRELLSLEFHPQDLGGMTDTASRLQEGIAGHQLIRTRRAEDYRAEVSLKFNFQWDDYLLIVRGRIDGLMETDSTMVAEEIKTTYAPLAAMELASYQAHEAQLKLYLYFLMTENPGKQVSGRLTYLNLDNLEEKTFLVRTGFVEGREFFERLAVAYLTVRREQESWIQTRNDSLAKWEFPFRETRQGQDELMEVVNQALDGERDLFAEAATGIGKTVAVLYPSLKRLAVSERIHQVFFLTAKTVGKEILKKTLAQAVEAGLRLRTVFIEAKERVCITGTGRCEADYCPYAYNYYRKIKPLLPEILARELITPEIVAGYAEAFQVCPFELSLDLALFADLIVADYNYLFDPGVYLRRFFVYGGRDYLFLIDEAHNLVARGREMYSASLSESDLKRLQHLIPGNEREVKTALHAIAAYFEAWREEMEDEQSTGIRLNQLPELLEPELQRLVTLLEEYLNRNRNAPKREELLQSFFRIFGFTRIVGMLTREYALYVKTEESRIALHLFCLNPGPLLRRNLDHGRMAIFFSATLSPQRYFQQLLGGKTDALFIRLTSPFLRENRLYLHIPGVDTRYQARSRSAVKLAQCIADMVKAKSGNYLVFFPSYAYLQTILPLLKPFAGGQVRIFAQTPGMSDAEKAFFLKNFTLAGLDQSRLGLAVLGGIFGEGVDLPGDALIGVLIVGPGLPGINEDQEFIRAYFDELDNQGFFYAYLVPGLIRVIQSAGRVFRRPEDKGVVILVDDRFADERYQELLPPDWFMPGRLFSNPEYREALEEFWRN
jgi:DNA excision repair protein ERCC-2